MRGILTHHKCASSWLAAYVARTCQLNGLEFVATDRGDRLPAGEPSIALFKNASYELLSDHISSGIHVVRNPLDVLVSAFYSHLSTHPLDGWPELAKQREVLCSVPREAGMMLTVAFLERADFYSGTPGPLLSMRLWDYTDPRILTIRMEDMVGDVSGTIGRWLRSELGTELKLPDAREFRFERFSGNRRRGEVDTRAHYRVGLPDQWRHDLPMAGIAYVRATQAPLMQRFYPEAYEKSLSSIPQPVRLPSVPPSMFVRLRRKARWLSGWWSRRMAYERQKRVVTGAMVEALGPGRTGSCSRGFGNEHLEGEQSHA